MTGPDFDPTVSSNPVQRQRRPIALIVVLAVLATATITVVGLYAAGAFSTEILAEPIQADGENPFMPAIGEGQPVAKRLPKTGVTVSGETSGLYGGTLNNAACDPAKMVAFLQQNPDKATAWADVLGVAPAAIPGYVAELTPLILRSDTAVTNHGFANGKATTLNSVLEAGTAVLVDKVGVPRVRCKCGNPLTPAKTYSRPAYGGQKWAEFDPQQITKVEASGQKVDTFVIINLANGESAIKRPAGSRGDRDEGRLEDARLDGRYTLTRQVISCSGFNEGCSTTPVPFEITCTGESQCTIARLDGVWLDTHALTRSGSTWTATGPEDGGAHCNVTDASPSNPVPGTTIEFDLTPVSAAAVGGVWRVERLSATYTVHSPGVPGAPKCGTAAGVWAFSN